VIPGRRLPRLRCGCVGRLREDSAAAAYRRRDGSALVCAWVIAANQSVTSYERLCVVSFRYRVLYRIGFTPVGPRPRPGGAVGAGRGSDCARTRSHRAVRSMSVAAPARRRSTSPSAVGRSR
jgi:hypothetical protein